MLGRDLAAGCMHTFQGHVVRVMGGDRCVGGVVFAPAIVDEEQAVVRVVVADTLPCIGTALAGLGTDILRPVGIGGLRASSSVCERVHGSYVAGYEADVRF
jgi:hypothetical protein